MESEQFEFVVKVSDTGIGIPAAYQSKILDPLFRCPNVVAYNRGTGLGLNIVRTVVDMLGGKMSVSSEEGEGSCFSVTLPRGERITQYTGIFPHLDGLLLNDPPIIRKITTKIVTDMGCTVHTVDSVEERIRHLRMNDHPQYEVIISDNIMGKLSGSDFFELVRNNIVESLGSDISKPFCKNDIEKGRIQLLRMKNSRENTEETVQ